MHERADTVSEASNEKGYPPYFLCYSERGHARQSEASRFGGRRWQRKAIAWLSLGGPDEARCMLGPEIIFPRAKQGKEKGDSA